MPQIDRYEVLAVAAICLIVSAGIYSIVWFALRLGRLNKFSVLMMLPMLFALMNFTYLWISDAEPYGILGYNWSDLKPGLKTLIFTCLISVLPFFLVDHTYDDNFHTNSPMPKVFYLSAILSITFLCVSYPWIFGIGSWRSSRLLPGDGWNGFYIVLYLMALLHVDTRSLMQRSLLITIPIVSIIGGERVDSLFLLPVAYMSGKLGRFRRSTGIIASIVLFTTASFVQFYRAKEEAGAEEILSSIVMNRTLTDVADVSLAVIKVRDDFGVNLRSEILSNYAFSLFPFNKNGGAGAASNIGNVTDPYYSNVNGGLFASELYAIGGYAVVFIGFWIYALIASFLMKRRNPSLATKLLTLYILVSVVRVSWYGLVYVAKPIYIILFVGLVFGELTRSIRAKPRTISVVPHGSDATPKPPAPPT